MKDSDKIGRILLSIGWPNTEISWRPEGEDYQFFLRVAHNKYSLTIPKEIIEDLTPEDISEIIWKMFEEVIPK